MFLLCMSRLVGDRSLLIGRGLTVGRNFAIIRRRNDYIIWFIAPAIGPNKSRKLTRLVAPAHNIRDKIWMKNNIHGLKPITDCLWSHGCSFYSNFAVYIVCRRYKPCEFLWFVWTDCWGNKSYYVITSPANCSEIVLPHSSGTSIKNLGGKCDAGKGTFIGEKCIFRGHIPPCHYVALPLYHPPLLHEHSRPSSGLSIFCGFNN